MQRKVVAGKVIVAIAVFCPDVGGSSASGDFCVERHKDTGSSHDISTCSSPISSTIQDCTFVYHDKSAVFSHFRTKQVKNAVNQAKMGFGAVNETAPKPIFYFRSRKIAKKSAVFFVSFSSVKTYRLRGSERI